MSVFVKDMEMPKCCEDCPMYDDEIGQCNQKLVHIFEVRDIGEQRPTCCPLIEITTPHGKLIDAAEMSISTWPCEKTYIRFSNFCIGVTAEALFFG